MKSEYYIPDNTSTVLHFLQEPFEPLTHPLQRRRRDTLDRIDSSTNDTENTDRYEKYVVEAVEVGTGLSTNDDDGEHNTRYSDEWNGTEEDEEYTPADYRITKHNDFTTARWALYKGIEAMADRLSCLFFFFRLDVTFQII